MGFPARKRFVGWYDRLTLLRAIRTVLAIAVLLVLTAGAVVRIVEPETFNSIGLAYWWAITTVTTVGYGDVVPVTTGGRVAGGMLMLTGLSLIPVITSVVVSALVAKRADAQREEAFQLYQEQAATLARIEQRLAELGERAHD